MEITEFAAAVDGVAEAVPEVSLALLAEAPVVPIIRVTLAVEVRAAIPDVAALELTLALALAPALPVALACVPSLSAPLVTVTGKVKMSSPAYVVVLLPGKFASLPDADSVQVTVSARMQSAVPVNALASPTPISRWYVEGPYTSVISGKRPQSFVSVPVGQLRAIVVADGLAETIEASMDCMSNR